MGMKKECSCGYWNKEQEECLYNGIGCAKDERDRPGVTEERIEEKAKEKADEICDRFIQNKMTWFQLKELLKDFLRKFAKEIQGK